MKTLYTGRGKLRVANFQFIQRQNGIKFTVHGNLVVHFSFRKEKCLKESWDLSFLEWECRFWRIIHSFDSLLLECEHDRSHILGGTYRFK